ncbi:MAG: hypothetical protein Q9218_006509 [Villophora microphyllina]
MTKTAIAFPLCKFPTHSGPRVWLITSGASPISINLSRQLLAHGDSVTLCVKPGEIAGFNAVRQGDFSAFWDEEVLVKEGWKSRARLVEMDTSSTSFSAAPVKVRPSYLTVREASPAHGRSTAIVGTVEELGASSRTSALIRDQFETNYFGQVNMIKAALPTMREKRTGHVSLAYEIAPFNIKVTSIQPNVEINVLTNPITAAPQQSHYTPKSNPAPLFREIIGSLLDRLDSNAVPAPTGLRDGQGKFHSDEIVTSYPQLSEYTRTQLLAETINALTAIGGHDNPPARHIVGHEAVASVKEKLKTVSEELEDFVEASCAVDIDLEIGSPQQGMTDNA